MNAKIKLLLLLTVLVCASSMLLAQPITREDITIGTGTDLARIPVDMYYKTSYFQMLIYPSDIDDFTGLITGIKFYNNFVSDLPGKDTKIWIQGTSMPSLLSGWVPLSDESRLVYDAPTHYPSGTNEIYFGFMEDFYHFDGRNLLITVQRPLDTDYHSTDDRFRTQTIGSNRARNYQSDYTEMDPYNPDNTGSLSGAFPMTTLVAIPITPAQISGTVTDDGEPLAGVSVALDGTDYAVTTDAEGEYELSLLPPGSYSLLFSKQGYQTVALEIVLGEGDELVIDQSIEQLSMVSIHGQIIASDTLVGLEGAFLAFIGYAPYAASTDADGNFVVSNVFAGQSYSYTITAPGYSNLVGEIEVGDTDFDMGTLTMNEVTSPPQSVSATIDGGDSYVTITWNAPTNHDWQLGDSMDANRAFEGYEVHRLRVGQEDDPASWQLLTDEIVTETYFEDHDWYNLSGGNYRWAVKSIYTNGVSSLAAISNSIIKEGGIGLITGIIINLDAEGISGATISAGEFSTTSNEQGNYSLEVVAGSYDVMITAPRYHPFEFTDVVVEAEGTVTLNAILQPTSNSDLTSPELVSSITGISPNPFNPQTSISFEISKAGMISLEILNVRGQKLKTIHEGYMEAGAHRIAFDANETNPPLGSGLYFLRLRSQDAIDMRKMVLSK